MGLWRHGARGRQRLKPLYAHGVDDREELLPPRTGFIYGAVILVSVAIHAVLQRRFQR
ncbi:MAG: hypothetical protein ABWZ82_05610 [Candidatus Limnocylindrales bacterium]